MGGVEEVAEIEVRGGVWAVDCVVVEVVDGDGEIVGWVEEGGVDVLSVYDRCVEDLV